MHALLRDSMTMGAGNATAALLSLAYSIYVARALGPEEYGIVGTMLSLFYLLSVGLGPITLVMARFSAEFTARGEGGKVTALFRLSLQRLATVGLLGVAASLPLSPVVAALLYLPSPVPVVLTALLAALSALLAANRGLLQGLQRFGALAANNALEAVLRLAVGVAMVVSGLGALGAVAAYPLAVAVTFAVALLLLRREARGRGADFAARRLFQFSGPVLASSLFFAAATNLDALAAKHFFSAAEAGGYVAVTGLAKTVNLLAVPFYSVAFPQFSALHARGEDPAPLLRRSLLLMAGAVAPAVAVAWLAESALVALLFGPGYHPAASLLGPYCLAIGVVSCGVLLTWYCLATERSRVLPFQAGTLLLEIGLIALFHSNTLQMVAATAAAAIAYAASAAIIALLPPARSAEGSARA